MNQSTRSRFVVTLAGLGVSAAAICLARGTDAAVGMPAGPFGFPALVLVHLFAAWPVAWGLAELWSSKENRRHHVVAILGFLATIVMSAGTYWFGNPFWNAFNGDLPTGFALGWLAREAWTLALMFPWCLAARQWFPDTSDAPVTRPSTWVFLGCALLAALSVPAAFADYLFRQQTASLEARFQEGRLAGLPELAARLKVAGNNHRVGILTIDTFDAQLAQQVAAYRQATEAPLPVGADQTTVMRRAALLATLGEHEAVIELLTPIVETNASAGLLVASVLDDMGRQADAAQRFRAVIELLNRSTQPDADRLRIQAFDSLAETLRDQHAYFAAEAAYAEAIRMAPGAEPHFRFQLGRHYALGGRPAAALQSFQRAAELDPNKYGLDRPEVQQQIRPLREGTPGCLLPMSAYRQPRS